MIDCQHPASISDDASEPTRVGGVGGKQNDGSPGLFLMRPHSAKDARRNERFIPVHHENASYCSWQCLQCHAHGIPGAHLLFLHYVPATLPAGPAQSLGAHGPHDDNGRGKSISREGIENTAQHRLARNRVQHFGHGGSHSGSLAGGQDDGRVGRLRFGRPYRRGTLESMIDCRSMTDCRSMIDCR
jgi:hypothetical protein